MTRRQTAEAAGATVIRQFPNAGKGAALRAGFRRALEDGAEAVVTLDGDGQHDPAEIPAFLEAHERSGAQLVVGRRNFAAMPPVRRASNTLGRMMHFGRRWGGTFLTTSPAIG